VIDSPLGRLMGAEMAEQPEVLARLAGRFASIAAAVREIGEAGDGLRGVAFLARGSSDNAALLGRYAIEQQAGLPTSLVAPSVLTAYHREPEHFRGWLLIALSQSGRTPEIVDIAERFGRNGAHVVAVTNDADSQLARAARLSVALEAGPELAVPATKTVTAQMMAVLAIAAGVGSGGGVGAEEAARLAGEVAALLGDTAPVEAAARTLAAVRSLAVVGRGACYPAALESALKLQETLGVMAHGFSSADFRHGPIAVCGRDVPALLLAGSGPADDDTRALRGELALRGAPIVEFGTGAAADGGWPALGHMGECLLATVRGQQLALSLARRLGIDPDQPAGLNKVTLTA
jgi:glutamine---fructose-6-phosphate transaminase (isomerizing)